MGNGLGGVGGNAHHHPTKAVGQGGVPQWGETGGDECRLSDRGPIDEGSGCALSQGVEATEVDAIVPVPPLDFWEMS